MLFDRIMEKGNIRPNNASLVSTFTTCAEHKIKGTIQDSSPSSPLNNILKDNGPLGGEVVVHTAP